MLNNPPDGISSLPAQFFQRGDGGFALGGFFAFATATAQFSAAVRHHALEFPVVVGTADGDEFVLRRFG
jgi:hypothetical protein